jgi:glycosidase
VPPAEWNAIAKFGFDAVWFIGVWERSSAGIAIANKNKNLVDDFRRALPDFKPEDNVGSPYCIRPYVVDRHLGGPGGLAVARRELAERGMKLLLDFVPNHGGGQFLSGGLSCHGLTDAGPRPLPDH